MVLPDTASALHCDVATVGEEALARMLGHG